MRNSVRLLSSVRWILLSTFWIGVSAVNAEEETLKFSANDRLTRSTSVEVKTGLPVKIPQDELLAGLKKPDDTEFWLGSFVLGDTATRSLAVAILHENDKQTLWVDTNRDQRLADETPLESDSNKWSIDIAPEYKTDDDDSTIAKPFKIKFAWDTKKKKLFKSTAGVLEGSVEFDGEKRKCNLIDFNHNGRWLDPEDRIILDINGNGKLSRITEQLLCNGMIQIRGDLYSILGDSSGKGLAVKPVTAKGQIAGSLKLADKEGSIVKLTAHLRSESGIQITIDDVDKSVVCPIGNYQVAELKLVVADDFQQYSFVFLRSGRGEFPCVVEDNNLATIALLDQLKLDASLNLVNKKGPGFLSVVPTLTTDSGLYLANSLCGKTSPTGENRLQLETRIGSSITRTGSSGFT